MSECQACNSVLVHDEMQSAHPEELPTHTEGPAAHEKPAREPKRKPCANACGRSVNIKAGKDLCSVCRSGSKPAAAVTPAAEPQMSDTWNAVMAWLDEKPDSEPEAVQDKVAEDEAISDSVAQPANAEPELDQRAE